MLYTKLDYYIKTDIDPDGKIRISAIFVHGDSEEEIAINPPIERKMITATSAKLNIARSEVKELARQKFEELKAL